jgi:hypothetical protein
MMAALSSSLRRAQPAISGRVRRQPRQTPVMPSTAQTFTQGVTIGRGGRSAGAEMSELIGDISPLGVSDARGALCIGLGLA